jgi:hypothetical protein
MMKANLLAAAVVTGLAFVAGAFVLIDALAHRDVLGILAGGGCCLACGWLLWNGGLPKGDLQ